MLNCRFSEPINLNPASTSNFVDYEFSKLICSSTQIELISNSTTGAEFYLSKTINYGDAILFWFLTLAFLFGIFTFIFKTFWKK